MDCSKTALKPAAVFGSLALTLALAQTPSPPAAVLRSVDAIVAQTMQREHVRGLSLAISQSGTLAYARGYGIVNDALHVPARAGTLYPIGSITKQFTAAAALREVQRGAIALDAPAQLYLPNYGIPRAVTVRDLLTQTSGLYSYTDDAQLREARSPAALLVTAASHALAFSPGTQFEYSNTNALALGLLLEATSHEAYATIVETFFARPLALNGTAYVRNVRLFTQGYDERGAPVAIDAPDYLFSAAGLVSTAPDLVRWEDDLYAGAILDKQNSNRIFEPFRLPDGTNTSYGMGAFVRTMYGRAVFYHTGTIDGYSAIVLHESNAHLTIALLTNRDRLDLLPLVKSIVALLDPPADRS